MAQRILLTLLTLLSTTAHAYSKSDFICPLTRPEYEPLLAKHYPEALNRRQSKLKFTWTKPLDQKIEVEARLSTVSDLYALAQKEIERSITIFKEPNAEVNAHSDLFLFFDQYVSAHSPRLTKRGALRKKDARACRQEALAFLRQQQQPQTSTPLLHEPKDTSYDPYAELAEAVSNTCLDGTNFNNCVHAVSKATLMCVSQKTREEMREHVDQSFESFKEVITKQSQKLASKTTDRNAEKKTLREAHYQIKLILSLFPSVAEQYLSVLAKRGTGLAELKTFSEKISRNEALTSKELMLMEQTMGSVVQICRVDFLMDVRETFKDVITWTSVGLTVSTLAFGPIFGVTLLPAIMNSGTTIGFLVTLNVLSHLVSSIDGLLMTKDIRSVFDQGKIADILFKIVRYQKGVMDTMISQIQNYESTIPESELDKKSVKVARKALLDAFRLSTEYQNILKLYSRLKTAKFNRAKQVMNILSFAMNIPTSVVYDQALFNTIGMGGSGRDALTAINELKNPSAAFPVLSRTRTALMVSVTVSSIQYSLIGLNHAQMRFITEALDSIFTFRP